MDGMLSQEEINALLSGMDTDSTSGNTDDTSNGNEDFLTDIEKDTVGEISNISMGTAATTLSSLVNQKVNISIPVVSYAKWADLVESYDRPCVFLQIKYKEGLDGNNILILKENDVKIIADLMMGGDGTNTEGERGDLHLSAICEAMNQMMGSAATSLSSMLNKTIDISPPIADLIDLQDNVDEGSIDKFLTGRFVKISFKMQIGDLVDSEIMQLYPFSFAKEMCEGVSRNMEMESDAETPSPTPAAAPQMQAAQPQAPQQDAGMGQPMMGQQGMGQQPMMGQPMMGQPMMGQPMMGQPMMGQPMMGQPMYQQQQPVNVQPAQFQAFSPGNVANFQSENIGLIMDVPLEVTVELGRTTKSISDILDFAPGKIIELDKVAGEPIDVLVNGKNVARGEVVVIEECFGIRITEIINSGHPESQ